MPKNTKHYTASKILLVEDDPLVLQTMRMLLRVDHHQVTTADNGATALDLYSQAAFDLVITDFDMPKMDGLKLAAAIRARVPNQRIILITAKPTELGNPDHVVDLVLVKPFSLQSLRDAITRLLA